MHKDVLKRKATITILFTSLAQITLVSPLIFLFISCSLLHVILFQTIINTATGVAFLQYDSASFPTLLKVIQQLTNTLSQT